MTNILVTDGEQRSALAVVRSLGRAGHRVIVASTRRHSLAGASRHAAKSVQVPDSQLSPAGFVRGIAGLVSQWSIEVLLPVTDPSLLALLSARDGFTGVVIPFPDLSRVRQASDKAELMQRAPRVGIRVPVETRLPTAADRSQLADGDLRFPLVIKPGRSVVPADGQQLKLGVSHAANRAELEAGLDAIPPAGYPVLLQERVVGPGIGVFLLVWNGETVAQFSHRRIREKPPAGGVSVYRESIPADPALVARSRALLDTYGWQGVAMIEYKMDHDGTPFLMEINGRFWGSLQLAIDAGVDFPAMLVALARGEAVKPVTTYRTAVRSRWWWGDVDHLVARLTKSAIQLSLPPQSPGRFRALADFVRFWRPGDRNEILRWNDPVPFLRETVEWFRGR